MYPGHPKTSVAQVVIPMTLSQHMLKPLITTNINLALKTHLVTSLSDEFVTRLYILKCSIKRHLQLLSNTVTYTYIPHPDHIMYVEVKYRK